MTTFYGDLETFSTVPLSHGTYRYAEAAEILLFAYAVDEGPVQVLDATQRPQDVVAVVRLANSCDEVVFHNSMFDRAVLEANGHHIPIGKWRDTFVQALCHSLPGGLKKLCEIYRVPEDVAKVDGGRDLIHLFCKPRPKNSELRRATRETHPKEWAEFVRYAGNDIEAMRYLYKRLPTWNYSGEELALWHLDQVINDRGMHVDQELARAAVATIAREKRRLSAETQAATSGAVSSTTQRDALLRYILREHGVELPDLTKDTLERRINDENLPDAVRYLLQNRQQAASGAPAKYEALLKGVSSDGRLRGTTQFCGAMRTGRSAGRTFQPHNLMRTPRYVKAMYDEAIEAITAGAADVIYENPTEVIAGVVRGAITAGPGKKLGIADWSNIEGRILSWESGEKWKIEAFRAFDAGAGHDLYALAYARAFNVAPEEVMADDKAGGIKRQVGKVQELALGYQGGVGAFVSMAANYRINLGDMAAKAWPSVPEKHRERAAESWEWAVKNDKTLDLAEPVYKACHALVHIWREANPNIVTFWKLIEDAIVETLSTNARTEVNGLLQVDKVQSWLRIRLPSGRYLCYPSARVEFDDRGRPKVSYMGVDQYTKKWRRIPSYGGKFAENVTQAIARDVLWKHGIPQLEANRFPIVLHVHDEPVAEVPEWYGEKELERMGEIMRTTPAWADGLPLAAAAHYATRYQKG